MLLWSLRMEDEATSHGKHMASRGGKRLGNRFSTLRSALSCPYPDVLDDPSCLHHSSSSGFANLCNR